MAEKERLHVLVYGTLRRGEPNHHLMKNAVYKRTIHLPGYTMASLGGFPAVCPGNPAQTIVCELNEIDPVILEILDCLEGYPSFYDRTLVDAHCARATENIGDRSINAWLYYMSADRLAHAPVIESGDWLPPATSD